MREQEGKDMGEGIRKRKKEVIYLYCNFLKTIMFMLEESPRSKTDG